MRVMVKVPIPNIQHNTTIHIEHCIIIINFDFYFLSISLSLPLPLSFVFAVFDFFVGITLRLVKGL